MTATTDNDLYQRWEQTSDVEELLKLSAKVASTGRRRVALSLACRKHALAVFCEMGDTNHYKAGIELVERVLSGAAKASELATLRGFGGAPTAFNCLQLRVPGAAKAFAHQGLLATNALSSVERVITYAVKFHVFTAVNRHPDWVRSERAHPANTSGGLWRTVQAFCALQPGFEAALQREETLRQVTGLKDALRPVLLPQAANQDLSRRRGNSGQAVRAAGLADFPCSPTVH